MAGRNSQPLGRELYAFSELLSTQFLIQVLGPFPIHAREQHFLSPAFPLNSILLITSLYPLAEVDHPSQFQNQLITLRIGHPLMLITDTSNGTPVYQMIKGILTYLSLK